MKPSRMLYASSALGGLALVAFVADERRAAGIWLVALGVYVALSLARPRLLVAEPTRWVEAYTLLLGLVAGSAAAYCLVRSLVNLTHWDASHLVAGLLLLVIGASLAFFGGLGAVAWVRIRRARAAS